MPRSGRAIEEEKETTGPLESKQASPEVMRHMQEISGNPKMTVDTSTLAHVGVDVELLSASLLVCLSVCLLFVWVRETRTNCLEIMDVIV